MPEAEKIDGVNLQTITINAASPDLLGTVMKKITDEVMKAIPEGALEKIAKEVVTSGKVVWRRSPYSSWDSSSEGVSISEETKKRVGEALQDKIQKQLQAYLETPEIQKFVADCVAEGVQRALQELPAATGNEFLSRLLGHTLGDTHIAHMSQAANLEGLAQVVAKTQDALMKKGILSWNDAPILHVKS